MGDRIMPLFITYGSYSQSGIKGMLENPEDRAGAVESMVEQAGGKLVALYMTTGENDFVLVSEAPDGEVAVALGMVAAASGSVSNLHTVRAWTSGDFGEIAKKAAGFAGSYTPPGN
jgi:uncharacterized protein with GYD domain